MNQKELRKQFLKKMGLLRRIECEFLSLWWSIQDRWWLITGTCPHHSTIKVVGAKKEVCLLCEKVLPVKKAK